MSGRSSPASTRLGRFARGVRAQSEPLGYILVLSVVVLGTTVVVGYGGQVIGGMQSQAESRQAQHSMTLFDSRAATVALGDSASQTVAFSGPGGEYAVDEDAGRLVIRHLNASGGGGAAELYNESLGRVTYRSGETELAYQAGGVWRIDPSGATRMVSPPEFHYSATVLTVPVIKVRGSDQGGGAASATIEPAPSRGRLFENNTSTEYGPIQNGSLEITVESAYYRAWADYFRQETTGAGTVRVDDAARTVTVELQSLDRFGTFQLPDDGESLPVVRLGADHRLEAFDFTLRPRETGTLRSFNKPMWSVYADQGDRHFEASLGTNTGNVDCGDNVTVSIYYSESPGETYHGWQTDDFYVQCTESDGSGGGTGGGTGGGSGSGNGGGSGSGTGGGTPQNQYLTLDLAGNATMEYTSLSKQDLEHFGKVVGEVDDATLVENATFDGHRPSAPWEPAWFTEDGAGASNDSTTVGRVTSHYLAAMNVEYDLLFFERNEQIDPEASTGRISYPGGRFVSSIHVTENAVRVSFH